MALNSEAVNMIRDKSFAYIAFNDSSGFPHVTPVWVDTDGRFIIINTAEGRRKQRLAAPGTRVTLVVTNPSNPYKYIMIKGKVVNQTKEGAEEHIDKMAQKYMGAERYPRGPSEPPRVLIYIEPVSVSMH